MKVTIPLLTAVAVIATAPVAHAQMKLPDLKKQPTPQAVLDEHFAALNSCDWDRLMAQYPEDGLKGMHFAPEHSTTIGDTFATQWVATAPFLAEPYRGSDAYITHDGYMQAMVSTFDGGALKRK